VAGRFFTRLGAGDGGAGLRLEAAVWGDTSLRLDAAAAGRRYRDLFTGAEFDASGGTLPLSSLLSPLPVALLERIEG